MSDGKDNGIPKLEDHHYYMFNKDFNPESTADAIRFILERNLAVKKPKCIKMLINSPGGTVCIVGLL